MKIQTYILKTHVGVRVTPSTYRTLSAAKAKWKALVPFLQKQSWVVGPSELQGIRYHGLTLAPPPHTARKGMGVYAGKDPTRASVEVQRTQEKDISRNFLLPQKQCSCLLSSHDLLENPSPSKSKHIPEECQLGTFEGLRVLHKNPDRACSWGGKGKEHTSYLPPRLASIHPVTHAPRFEATCIRVRAVTGACALKQFVNLNEAPWVNVLTEARANLKYCNRLYLHKVL